MDSRRYSGRQLVRHTSPVNGKSLAQLHERALQQLGQAGLQRWELHRSEASYLPRVLEDSEAIHGAVYGQSKGSFVLLVATNYRIIILDTKPLFVTYEAIRYDNITATTLEWMGLTGKMRIQSGATDVHIRSFNRVAAERLYAYIKRRCSN